MPLIRRRKLNALRLVKAWVESRGAGSEVWNRVYMIAPVKKFGRVRLTTNFFFKTNMAEKMMSFCSVLRFTAFKHQEKVFMKFFYEISGHLEA